MLGTTGRCAIAGGIAVAFACGAANAAVITGWNTTNVAVSTDVPGVEGESVIYDRAPTAAGAQTSGKVIFDGDEANTPGLKTLTGLYTTGSYESSGGRTTGGCIMASSSVECDGGFQSGKRFKNVITGFKPVDFVFDTDPNAETPVDPATGANAPYQVFHRLINGTGRDIKDFTISLGVGVGGDFTQSLPDDGLRFSDSFSFGPTRAAASSQFPFGLFGDASGNPNFDIDGFFAPERSGFNMVFGEDQIGSAGIFGPYQSLFGNWMTGEDVPLGALWDDDGNPLTDAVLIGWEREDGVWEQRRDVIDGVLTSITPVEFASFDALNAAFFASLFSEGIEDLANLNVNYAIDLTGFEGSSFTLRVDVAPVPLPAGAPLLVAGLGALAWVRRRRKA